MGEMQVQNNPFTSQIILALDKICEAWAVAGTDKSKADVGDLMCYVLAEFCGNLRDKEVLLLLKGLLYFWNESLKHNPPYLMLTLHGKFKGKTGLRWRCVPIPIKTRFNLPIWKWFNRAVRRRVKIEKWEVGWFFADDKGQKQKMTYYDAFLTNHMNMSAAAYPDLIGEMMDLEQLSLWRSGRRGATTAAHNNRVDEGVIMLMGRWRKVEQAKGTNPGLPMSQVYTEVKHSVPAMLKFASTF